MSLFRETRSSGTLVLFRWRQDHYSFCLSISCGVISSGLTLIWTQGKGWGWLAAAMPPGLIAAFNFCKSAAQIWTHQQLVLNTGARELVLTVRTPLKVSSDRIRFDEVRAVRLGGHRYIDITFKEPKGWWKVDLLLENRAIRLGEGGERACQELASRMSGLLAIPLRDEVEVYEGGGGGG